MIKITKEFSVPYYIFEEIIDYIEMTKEGYCKTMKWENIKSLLKMAVISNKMTIDQCNFIIERYSREMDIP